MLTKEDISTVFEKLNVETMPSLAITAPEQIMSYPEFLHEHGKYVYDEHTRISTSSVPFSDRNV